MKRTSMHSSGVARVWNVSTVLLGAILLACQGVDSNGGRVPSPSSDAAIGSGAGCTRRPDCGGCSTCYDMCTCQTEGSRSPRCWAQCPPDSPPPTVDANPPTVDAGPPPPIPTEPVTLTMDAFDVEPGEEVFQCQSYANPFRRDVDI